MECSRACQPERSPRRSRTRAGRHQSLAAHEGRQCNQYGRSRQSPFGHQIAQRQTWRSDFRRRPESSQSPRRRVEPQSQNPARTHLTGIQTQAAADPQANLGKRSPQRTSGFSQGAGATECRQEKRRSGKNQPSDPSRQRPSSQYPRH